MFSRLQGLREKVEQAISHLDLPDSLVIGINNDFVEAGVNGLGALAASRFATSLLVDGSDRILSRFGVGKVRRAGFAWSVANGALLSPSLGKYG